MPKTDPFYLVWAPSGPTPPRYRHPDREAAKCEAERLARLNPGREFFVLAATDRLVVDNLIHDDLVQAVADEMPF